MTRVTDCTRCERAGAACYMHRGDGIGAPALCRMVGVTYRQIDYWARTDLLVPSLREATGNGSSRRYSVGDARIAFAIKRGLDSGLSLQSLRRLLPYLRDSEGCDLLYVGADGSVGACDTSMLVEVIEGCGGVATIIVIALLDFAVREAQRAVA